MKLRIAVIGLFSALVLILALPVITPADNSGTTQITGSIAAFISSVSPNSGVQGNTYSSVIISGTDLTGASSVSFGADITTNTFNVDSDSQMTASISISSLAVAGVRDVSVTVSGVVTVKTSGFTVAGASFSITAPSAISLGNMVKGETAAGHSVTPGSVTTNSATWTVVARDSNPGGTKGYMLKAGPAALQNQLRIGKTAATCSTPAGDSAGLVYTQTGGTSVPLYVEQDVTSGDAVGAYSITIAFIGSTP